jgi:hypothetical protein
MEQMGHIRLGKIPTSKKWKQVVELIAHETASATDAPSTLAADIERIAAQTLNAAQAGLRVAVEDKGLRFTFYLLTQLVLASRHRFNIVLMTIYRGMGNPRTSAR